MDGKQALEFISRRKYDLILMDIQMPVLDGFACTRKIRKHFKDIPILAITASPKNGFWFARLNPEYFDPQGRRGV